MHRSMLGADRCTSITNKFVSDPTTITVLGVSASDKALETINASAPSKNSDGVCGASSYVRSCSMSVLDVRTQVIPLKKE